MKDRIIKEIKNMKGSLLGIGIDDELLLDEIDNNDDIDLCYILSNASTNSQSKKFKLFNRGRSKTVNIKKLQKYFRKKSLNNILCDYDVIKKFTKSFIGGSVYINNGKLIIYGKQKDLKDLKEKYERYTDDIKLIKKEKHFILIINNEKTKYNLFKDTFYKTKDFLNEMLDYLTDFLTN